MMVHDRKGRQIWDCDNCFCSYLIRKSRKCSECKHTHYSRLTRIMWWFQRVFTL